MSLKSSLSQSISLAMEKKLRSFISLKERLSTNQKIKLLRLLKNIQEEYTGNIGGETDIRSADNLQVNEDEFTSATKPNVIAKTFDTEADYDSYVNQRRGIEITPKERQSIDNYKEAKPTQIDKFHVRYETTDDFGNNDTTTIKKLKEGTQFCWTAFSKHETAEEEGKPEDVDEPVPSKPSHTPSEPEKDKELTVNDPIRIIRSITFSDETQGANILADFLEKLDI